MRKILPLLVITVFVSAILCLTVVKAGENPANPVNEMPLSDANSIADISQFQPLDKQEESRIKYNIPEWLKRTSIGTALESHQKPRYYIETVQPLYQSEEKKDTFFTHLRISGQDGYGTYSAGFGYRKLLFDNNLMAGINTFFDYQDPNQHYRQGVGLEFIGKYTELRSNGYFGLSPTRVVEETTSSTTRARVANGYDVEFGVPVPYLPWFKVFGGYYWYDFKEGSDMEGWKGRAELKPLSFMTVNLETYDDNKGPHEWRADVRLSLYVDSFTPKDIFAAITPSFQNAFPDVDLKKRTLDRVERNFTIQLETYREVAGATIEIGRND